MLSPGVKTPPKKFYSRDKVMEKIKDLYHQYSDQIIAWYDGLEQLYQYGVFFLLFLIGLFIGTYVLLSRISK
jgi:hypothetical protein